MFEAVVSTGDQLMYALQCVYLCTSVCLCVVCTCVCCVCTYMCCMCVCGDRHTYTHTNTYSITYRGAQFKTSRTKDQSQEEF